MSPSSFGRCRLNHRRLNQGLTLVELVVVLAILAVLAGVAVRSLEPIADQARYEATQKTLESAKNAIVEDRIQSSGTRQVAGFVSDVGRLPASTWMLTDTTGTIPFLIESGAVAANDSAPDGGIRLAGARRAGGFKLNVRNAVLNRSTFGDDGDDEIRLVYHVTGGITSIPLSAFSFADRSGPAASSPPANPTTVDCSGVSLRCGWRGPYLTVPDPDSGLTDGWGQQIELRSHPGVGDDVHLIWTAVTNQYTDQLINVQRLGLQTVTGIIQDPVGAAKAAEVVLVYPDLALSTTTLSVMADADGNNSDNRFRFENVPVGVRALVIKDAAGSTQATRYVEVTPMQQANLTISVTEF